MAAYGGGGGNLLYNFRKFVKLYKLAKVAAAPASFKSDAWKHFGFHVSGNKNTEQVTATFFQS